MTARNLKVTVLIPAYNEAPRLPEVLAALAPLPPDWEVIVIDDGSRDGTGAAARAHPGARVVELPVNRGKGAALWAGARCGHGDVFLLLDADLRGLTWGHVEALLRPVLAGEADMAIGLFRGGRGVTDLSHRVAPWISGQRAVTRAALLSLPGMAGVRQGVEALLTRAARERGWRVRSVPWAGVTHAMKEEKLGLWAGLAARLRMYAEVLGGGLASLRDRGQAAPPEEGRCPRDAARRLP